MSAPDRQPEAFSAEVPQPASAASTSAAPAAAAEPSSSSDAAKVGQDRKGNCMVCFESVWVCYSPAYQLQQYYMYGQLDDCFSKWTDLWACLKRKTKFREEVEQQAASHPLWNIRTKSEAKDFWKQEFGHLGGEGGGGSGVDDGQHSGRPTLV